MSKYSDTTEMVTPHHTRAGNNYQAGGVEGELVLTCIMISRFCFVCVCVPAGPTMVPSLSSRKVFAIR